MRPIHAAFLIPAVLAACAIAPPEKQPEVPAAVRAPDGQAAYIEAFATGVQIYECTLKPDSTFEWVYKAPEATMVDRAGQDLGKHYAGPSWESVDGSIVVGEVKGRDPGPDPNAIPWLLLTVKKRDGLGVMSSVLNIQRINTVGGLPPPPQTCSGGTVNRQARMPYKATYYFYR